MPEQLHAVIEIMGHRRRAGAISDATLGGAPMLRIEHPTLRDHTGDGPLVEYYAPTAIFAIRPCSPAEATQVAGWAWRTPEPSPHELDPTFDDLVDDDGDGPF